MMPLARPRGHRRDRRSRCAVARRRRSACSCCASCAGRRCSCSCASSWSRPSSRSRSAWSRSRRRCTSRAHDLLVTFWVAAVSGAVVSLGVAVVLGRTFTRTSSGCATLAHGPRRRQADRAGCTAHRDSAEFADLAAELAAHQPRLAEAREEVATHRRLAPRARGLDLARPAHAARGPARDGRGARRRAGGRSAALPPADARRRSTTSRRWSTTCSSSPRSTRARSRSACSPCRSTTSSATPSPSSARSPTSRSITLTETVPAEAPTRSTRSSATRASSPG